MVTVSPVTGRLGGVGDGGFHEVGFDGVGCAGGDVEVDVGGRTGGLVHAEDEGGGVFGLLHGGEDDIGIVDRSEGMSGREGAGVGEDLRGGEWGVELQAAMDRERLLPGAGVGVEGVGEVLVALVGVGVRPGGRAEEGEAEEGCRRRRNRTWSR